MKSRLLGVVKEDLLKKGYRLSIVLAARYLISEYGREELPRWVSTLADFPIESYDSGSVDLVVDFITTLLRCRHELHEEQEGGDNE